METAVVARGVSYLNHDCGNGTSNDAEWLALVHAAELAISIGARHVVLLGDSAVVVGQANGVNKCRNAALRGHYENFVALRPRFERIRIKRISRYQNLAGIALTKARWS